MKKPERLTCEERDGEFKIQCSECSDKQICLIFFDGKRHENWQEYHDYILNRIDSVISEFCLGKLEDELKDAIREVE